MQFRPPPVFTLWEALPFWVIYIWAFIPEARIIREARKQANTSQDRGTMRVILIANQLALLAGFALSSLVWLSLPGPRIWIFAGSAILASGSLLRRWCFRTLGRHFTGSVTVTSDQPVIDSGPYRLVRHPSYLGGILMWLGIGVACGNVLSIAVLTLTPAIAYQLRMNAEERALVETIGDPYQQYMARTKRLIPYLY